MNTYAKKILSVGACALALTISGGTVAIATANAEVRPPFETLLSPASYEQYLPLSAPSDVAVNDDFTAIADGSSIYVYNRAKDVYTRYEHTKNTAAEKNTVSKLQFGSDGILYFLDASTYLYALTPETLATDAPQPQETGFSCSTFTLQGNDVYFTNVSSDVAQLSKTTLSSLSVSGAITLATDVGSNPVIAYADGYVYYTDNGVWLNKVSADASAPVSKHDHFAVTENLVTSMHVYDDEIAFTDNKGSFYVYNLTALDFADKQTDDALRHKDETGGYKAVTRHGAFLYAVKEQSVRQYDCQNAAFTDFEISANSSSTHRLRGATDSAVCKQTLVTADAGNSRLSVYSETEKTYRVFSTDVPYEKVATDGKNAVVCTADQVALYALSDGERLFVTTNFSGHAVGVAAVYGKYYFVTDTNHFYSITWQPYDVGAMEGATSGYAYFHDFVQKTSGLTPELLTSDVYGNLYVATSNNEVHCYDETAFMNAENYGEEVCQIEDGCTKILVNLQRHVYAVKGNAVYIYQKDVPTKTVDLGAELVYSQTTDTPVTAVAFSAETPHGYVIYNGNLTVQTTELWLYPNMQMISVDNADETLFGNGQATCEVVKTSKNALLIAFDLETTQGAQYFPYLGYLRAETEYTGLKIGSTQSGYDVVAVYDKQTQTYTTYLTLPAFVTTVETVTPYDEENQTVAYVTNAIRLYKFPYLTDLLTFASVPKNAQVKLVGEMNELDYEYYYVAYQDGETTKYGYIPKAYVTPFNGAPPQTETEIYGDATASEDSVWRMTYILLGVAAILVLADYLILRPKKED